VKSFNQVIEEIDYGLKLGDVKRLEKTVFNFAKASEPGAVSFLLDQLSKSETCEYVRIALGILGDTHAVEPLVYTLYDEDEFLRINAKVALIKINKDTDWEARIGS